MRKVMTAGISFLFFAVTISFFSLPAHAGYFEHREIRQQNRIYQGVKQGTINCRELHRLEMEQCRIARERRRILADGYLSWREKFKLERDMNRASRHIYRAKHNGW